MSNNDNINIYINYVLNKMARVEMLTYTSYINKLKIPLEPITGDIKTKSNKTIIK